MPDEPDRPVDADAFARLRDRWQGGGLLADEGPGPDRDGLIPGGFRRIWLDLAQSGALFANQLGGFRVRCPRSGAPIARPFAAAMERWRSGGPRLLDCSCGSAHPLPELDFQPPAAFARGAIIFVDAASADPTERAARDIQGLLGPYRLILRRPS